MCGLIWSVYESHQYRSNIWAGFTYVEAPGPVSWWRPLPLAPCSLVGQLTWSSQKKFFLLVGGGPQMVKAPGPWPLWPMPKSGPGRAYYYIVNSAVTVWPKKFRSLSVRFLPQTAVSVRFGFSAHHYKNTKHTWRHYWLTCFLCVNLLLCITYKLITTQKWLVHAV